MDCICIVRSSSRSLVDLPEHVGIQAFLFGRLSRAKRCCTRPLDVSDVADGKAHDVSVSVLKSYRMKEDPSVGVAFHVSIWQRASDR